MKSLKNNNQGSSLLLALVIILVLVIAGAVGYYVWQKNENKKSSATAVVVNNNKSTPITFEMNTSPLLGGACGYRTIVANNGAGICINEADATKIINDNQAQITQSQTANPSSQVLANVAATVSYTTKDIPAGVYPGAKTVATEFLNITKLDKVTIVAKANQ